MPYSELLADRIRAALAARTDVIEKKMFGGIAFMVAGSMACGIVGKDLMARVGPDRYEDALSRPHARLMDFTGRPLRGFVLVGAPGIRTDRALQKWIDETVAFAVSQPKRRKPRKRARKSAASHRKRGRR
jgi:hypothetical protein